MALGGNSLLHLYITGWGPSFACRSSMERRASQVVQVVENSPTKAWDSSVVCLIPGSRRSTGGGNGNPLQYSCLENPMDWGAWRATVHGVTKGQMQLSTFAHGKNMPILKGLKSSPQLQGTLVSKIGTSCKLSTPSISHHVIEMKLPRAVFLAESEILKLESSIWRSCGVGEGGKRWKEEAHTPRVTILSFLFG